MVGIAWRDYRHVPGGPSRHPRTAPSALSWAGIREEKREWRTRTSPRDRNTSALTCSRGARASGAGSEKGAAIYSVIAMVIGVALGVAAVVTIDNWAQWLVLGVIVLSPSPLMIALSPNREGAGSSFKIGR